MTLEPVADVNIRFNQAVENGQIIALKRDNTSGTSNSRKGYIRYDISGLPDPSLVSSATFQLALSGTSTNNTVYVYGHRDAVSTNVHGRYGDVAWSEQDAINDWSGTNHVKAPANSWDGDGGYIGNGWETVGFHQGSTDPQATALGTLSVQTSMSSGTLLTFSTANLRNFIRNDTNGTLTFMLYTSGIDTGGGTRLFSRESATPPKLQFSVTESITWNVAGDGNWDTAGVNWLLGPLAASYQDADTVNFTNTAGGVITVAGGGVTPGGVNVSAASGTYTFAGGSIGGSGTLIKSGGGTLVMNNENTYSGATTVSGGVLVVNNTTGSGTGSGAVVVKSGGTLGGTGTIGGATTIEAGGVLAPGTSVGALNLLGDLTFDAGSFFDIDIQSDGQGPGIADLVDMSGATNTLILSEDAYIRVHLLDGFSPNGAYTILRGENELSGRFNPEVLVWDGSSYLPTFADGKWFAVSYGNSVVLTVVPEPGAWLLLLSALACGLLARRRRRG